MLENIDLKQIERNVLRDCCQDGLPDMLLGAHSLSIGLLLLADSVLFVIFPIVFYPPLIRGLKKRFIYPRTGYVELRQGDPQPLLWLLLGSFILGVVAFVAVLNAAGVISQPAQWYRWTPIFSGILMAGSVLGLALRVGLVRYYVVAGVALADGPFFALLPLGGKLENIGLFSAAVGAVVLARGVVAFVGFLRQHPRLAEEDSSS